MNAVSMTLAFVLGVSTTVTALPADSLASAATPPTATGSHAPNGDGASRTRTKAPYRLIYNNDTTNTAGIPSPWHEDGEPFREEMLVASIEEVADHGVDAYMLSPGMGWVPWWQSDVDPDFYDWWQARTGLKIADASSAAGFAARGYDRYVFQGGDMVQVLVDTCRRHNMAPFVSLRLNDVHLQEYYDRKDFNSLVSCRLYAEHPEWHIDPQHAKREGYYKRRGMNWAVPEVRDYKLALLTELAEKYDLAGLELDFLRDDTLFCNEVPQAQRVDIITRFVQEVRRVLDRTAAPGQPRYLCVRIPLEIKRHSATGLDVAKLRQAGVDMFNLSGWYHTTQRTDLAAVRKLVPDAAVYLEMTHSTGWHPHFVKPSKYGTQGDPRTSDHQFYTTALLAHRNGADGLSLFNFVYYRSHAGSDVPVTEPPFRVLDKLNDVPFLERQPRYYMAAGTSYFRQIGELKQTAPLRIELDMARSTAPRRDEAQSDCPARLRVHTLQALTTEHRIAVTFNGTPLELCDDASGFFENPYDSMISPRGHRRAWILPDDVIRDGLNTVVLQLESGNDLRVVYLDAGVPVQYLDAPISGSSEQARRGEVTTIVGGPREAFDACRDLMDCFSAKTIYAGPCGAGAKMKLVSNLVLGLNRAALAEGLVFARAIGLDADAALEMPMGSMAYSRIMDTKGRKMVEGDFRTQARLSQHLKDIRLILEAAVAAGEDLPLTDTHRRLLEAAEAAGFGDADNSAIIRAFDRKTTE